MGRKLPCKVVLVLMGAVNLWVLVFVPHSLTSPDVTEPRDSSLKVFDQHPASHVQDISAESYNKRPMYFNCHNIKDIHLASRLGSGISKSGFLGLYSGRKVVVRMTSQSNVDSSRCLIEKKDIDNVHFNKTSECLRLGAVRLMKEIVMLQQLNHPGIIKLLGYCIRSEEVSSTNLSEHGAIVVSEYGQVLNITIVDRWTLRERLEKALELMDLFLYLDHSPLGSIEYPDFKLWHFVLLDNRIKAIDFDDATSLEPLCPVQNESFPRKCIFDLPCIEGRCRGYNAKVNMWRFNGTFSPLLFPETHHDKHPMLATVVKRLSQFDITAWELKTMIEEVLQEGDIS